MKNIVLVLLVITLWVGTVCPMPPNPNPGPKSAPPRGHAVLSAPTQRLAELQHYQFEMLAPEDHYGGGIPAVEFQEFVKCGPCEMKYELCGYPDQKPQPGPYSNFEDDGVTVHCNPETGFSTRFTCTYDCKSLKASPMKLACSYCNSPVAQIESLGKDCTDLQWRYSNGLDVTNAWYASFWDNLASTCQNQNRCTCTSAAAIKERGTYNGPVEIIETKDYDLHTLKGGAGGGVGEQMIMLEA